MEDRLRIGIGYDVHPLSEGRRLVLGGVEIPFAKGLSGWSDADVLSHAIIDALLGAATLGDIGSHFPPGAAEYRDISSLVLLEKVSEMLKEEGWRVANIDTTVIAEEPHLDGFSQQMREKISRTLGIEAGQVSVKASTSARLGFIGEGQGIAAQAVALIESTAHEQLRP
jgi:2-C-methyl-D-erythritol 2,4-cyclodiphosphate synthase